MKKTGLIVFVFAPLIGLTFSTNCTFTGIKGLSGIQGSRALKTEKRPVTGFKKIDASGAVNVEISIQNEFNVELSADDNLLANIKTEMNGETLKIYSEDNISPKTEINIKIAMPAIEELEVSGASSGRIAEIKTDSLKVKASDASRIRIQGQAEKFEADASGASTIDAESLRAVDVAVEASGASKAFVLATGNLGADASGASKVTYSGEPKSIKQNSSGASSITKK